MPNQDYQDLDAEILRLIADGKNKFYQIGDAIIPQPRFQNRFGSPYSHVSDIDKILIAIDRRLQHLRCEWEIRYLKVAKHWVVTKKGER